MAAESLPVVCAQNGVASEPMALRRFGHVYGMCVWLPATHLEPGTVQAQGAPLAGLLHIGRYPAGTDATAERIGADLAGSRFLAPVVRGRDALEVRQAAGQPGQRDRGGVRRRRVATPAADLRQPCDGRRDRGARRGRHRPREPGGERPTSAATGSGSSRSTGSPRGGGSSWQSLTRGTGSIEADFLNGEIVLLGRAHGVPTPVNEVLQRLANQAARERQAPGSTTPGEIMALLPA